MDAEKLVSVYVKIRDAKATKTKEMEDAKARAAEFCEEMAKVEGRVLAAKTLAEEAEARALAIGRIAGAKAAEDHLAAGYRDVVNSMRVEVGRRERTLRTEAEATFAAAKKVSVRASVLVS
jgi:hypothetical protein